MQYHTDGKTLLYIDYKVKCLSDYESVVNIIYCSMVIFFKN